MGTAGAITEYIDVAQLVLYVFWAFFFGLVIYIRREDRREGYPLEAYDGSTGADGGFIFMASPKKFISIQDGSVRMSPSPDAADRRPVAATPTAPWDGAPFEPTGDPMNSCIGPGSWAERPDVPDLTLEGEPKIVPLRAAPGWEIEECDANLRGMDVIGCDGEKGGVVRELWVDRSDILFRYAEVEVDGGTTVLLPLNFCNINKGRNRLEVYAVKGAHFAGVPPLKNPDQVTMLEEEKVVAYYGGGMLYADPARLEPLV